MRLARSLLIATLGLTLAQAACDEPSGTSTPGDTAEVFFPDITDTTQAETTDTAQVETTDTSRPETTDTAQPETTDTAQPETTDTAQPETTDTTQPETTDTTDTTEPDSDTVGPGGWTCSEEWYGDGDCDCGCGIVDVDCPSGATAADCDFCTACSAGTDCEGALVPGDITECVVPECGDNLAAPSEECDGSDLKDQTCVDLGGFSGGTLRCTLECEFDTSGCEAIVVPAEWTCNTSYYGDGDCDCGCGVIDSDCPANATAADCEYCYCETIDCEGALEPADITQCIEAECGDGLIEGTEDCEAANLNGATCASEGYIGGTLACGGSCDFDYTACERATAPPEWVCDTDWYGDGDCDCGCGVMDIDCPAAATVVDCEYCLNCDITAEDCSTVLDPTDVTQCIEP